MFVNILIANDKYSLLNRDLFKKAKSDPIISKTENIF